MPVTKKNYRRVTKKADTPKRRRQWNKVYQSCKARGGSEGSCIRQASGAVKKSGRHK